MKNRISMVAYSKQGLELRWLIRSDLKMVCEIEQSCCDNALDVRALSSLMARRNTIGMVGTLPDHRTGKHFIAGYCIYDLELHRIKVRRFLVNPNCRRLQIGSELMKKMLTKLNDKRPSMELLIRESNLVAQLFLRSHNFKATQILRGKYEDTEEDGYVMRHSLIPQFSHGVA